MTKRIQNEATIKPHNYIGHILMDTEADNSTKSLAFFIKTNKIAIYSALVGFLPVLFVSLLFGSNNLFQCLFWSIVVPVCIGGIVQCDFKVSIRKKKQIANSALKTSIHVHVNDVYVAELTPEDHIEILESVMNDPKNYIRQFVGIGRITLCFVRQYIIVFPLTLLTIAILALATADPQVILNVNSNDIKAVQSFIVSLAFLVPLLLGLFFAMFPQNFGFVNAFSEDLAFRVRQKLNIQATGKVDVVEIYKLNKNSVDDVPSSI